MYNCTLPLTCKLEMMSGQCCVLAAFFLEKKSGSDSTGGWVGVGTGLDGCRKLCHHQGSNPGLSSL